MSDRARKPVPKPAPESVPYWEAAKRHELALPKCNACGKFWFPPSRSCPNCLAVDFDFKTVSGRGKVYSFVTFHRVYHPAFAGEVPYVVAIVELEEGPRLLSNIVGIKPDAVQCEMPVKVVFDDVADDVSVPKFAPVSGAHFAFRAAASAWAVSSLARASRTRPFGSPAIFSATRSGRCSS